MIRPLVLIVGVMAASLVPATVRSQCWQVSPGHGAEGFPTQSVTASTLWDPGDGTALVIAVESTSGDYVEYWSKGQWVTLGGSFNFGPRSLATYNG